MQGYIFQISKLTQADPKIGADWLLAANSFPLHKAHYIPKIASLKVKVTE